MTKRILSVALALAVLLVALPIIPMSINAGAVAAEGDIALTPATWPTWVTDRVIQDFEGLTTNSTETTENGGTIYKGVGSAQPTNTTVDGKYRDQFAAFGTKANNVLTIANGKLYSTLSEKAIFDFSVKLRQNENTFPSANTSALKLKVDLTGVTSIDAGTKVRFELTAYVSSGSGSGYTGYSEPGKTFYYLPDPTTENPNPEMEILVSEGNNYHGRVWGYAGQSGTIIVPLNIWDTAGFTNFGGSASYDTLHTFNSTGYRQRSWINIQSEYYSYGQGDVFALDSAEWVANCPVNYDYKEVAEDFTNFVPDFDSWTAGYYNYTTYSNDPGSVVGANTVAIEDGRFAITPNNTALDGTRFTTNINIPVKWDSQYEALSFDIDLSETNPEGDNQMRFSFVGRNGPTDGTNSGFLPKKVILLGDNGKVTILTNDSVAGSSTWGIPGGFKGTAIFPAESMKKNSGTDGLNAAFTYFEAQFEIISWQKAWSVPADENDTDFVPATVYVDNFTYYYNAPGLAEGAGTDFSQLEDSKYVTEAMVTENIRTVEAWVKTSAAKDQMFIAEMFDDAVSSASLHIEDATSDNIKNVVKSSNLRVGMNATGNPYFFYSDKESAFINFTCTNAIINDGEWNHVAFVIDETLKEIRCYVNGANMGSQSFVNGEVTYAIPKNQLAHPVTVGNRMPLNERETVAFEGTLANVRIWSDARTGTELYNNSVASVGAEAEGLVAEWLLTGEEFTAETTGKYDIYNFAWDIDNTNDLYEGYNRDAADDEFSIVFLPDTQCVVNNWGDKLADAYNWVVENQDRLNIQAVMGVGDIVERGSAMPDGSSSEPQWQLAANTFKILTDAGIPWTVVPGNHDYKGNSPGGRDYAFFKQYFTVDSLVANDAFKLGGTYFDNDISSAYYYLTPSAESKYILLCLELEPRAAVVQWAKQVVENHPDYRVIVTTHRYMNASARVETHTTGDMYTGASSGEQVWNEILSQYSNVDMIVAGHYAHSSMVTRVDEAVNGNDVLQILFDTQTIDYDYAPLNAVLIARFKNDGSSVTFNVYSPSQDLFVDQTIQDVTYDLGTQEDELGDPVDMSGGYGADEYFADTTNLFHTLNVANNFAYFKSSQFKGSGFNSQENGSYVSATWVKGTVEAKNCITADKTGGWYSGQIQEMPSAPAGTTAWAIHIDATNTAKARNYRWWLDTNGDGTSDFSYANGKDIHYLLDDETKTLTKGTDDVSIPAGFKGYMIVPFVQGSATDTTGVIPATANNKAWTRFTTLGGAEGESNIFDNWSYLKGGYVYPAAPTTVVGGNTVITGVDATMEYALAVDDAATAEWTAITGTEVTGLAAGTYWVRYAEAGYNYASAYVEVTVTSVTYTVEFKDSLGNTVDTVTVAEGETIAEEDIPEAPVKYGYTFIDWSEDITLPVYADMVVTPVYEKDVTEDFTFEVTPSEEAEVEIQVTIPEGQDKLNYNDRVVLAAPTTNAEGAAFSYWMVNGAKFAYSSSISFLAFGNMEVQPVYGAEDADDKNIIYNDTVLSTTPSADGSKFDMHVKGVIAVDEDSQCTEIGILFAATDMTADEMLTAYNNGESTVVKLVSKNAVAGRQFVYNVTGIKAGATRCAVAYAVIDGEMVVAPVSVCTTR